MVHLRKFYPLKILAIRPAKKRSYKDINFNFLVILLLVLNMTVAVGTLNGLIYYANIVYANNYILLNYNKMNFISYYIYIMAEPRDRN